MRTVARFRDPYEAHIARSQLEAAGLEAFVFDDHTITANWLYSGAIGGVRVCVAEPDEAAALEILSTSHEPGVSSDPCPICGSRDVAVSRYSLWSVIPALLFATPLFFPRRSWRCGQCGASWGPGREPTVV